MVGGFSFKLAAKRVEYQFDIKRKVMRITGDSATGKSELVRLLADSQIANSGVTVNCKYKCEIINDLIFRRIKEDISIICQKFKNHNSSNFMAAMRNLLEREDNTLFFVDEDFTNMNTDEFALFCKFTDAFFVFSCRNPLYKIPYSYTEIYKIKTSGKFHTLIPVFDSTHYHKFYEDKKMIIEDSGSGFEFFHRFYDSVVSAQGKSKINALLTEPGIEVIADGAAFGCEIEKITWNIFRKGLDTKLFLPESFEYLLITSELFKGDVRFAGALDPVHTISGRYFSWEQYFTELLTETTQGLVNNYSKSGLNECYYKACCCKGGKVCNIKQTGKKKKAVLGKYLLNDSRFKDAIQGEKLKENVQDIRAF